MLTLKKCAIAAAVAYLGGIQCDEKQVTGFILMDRTVRIDPATFDKTVLDGLIAQNKVIGTVKDFNAEDADVDPGFTDMQSGDRNQNTLGVKRWNMTFFKSSCFQNEIQKLNRSERYGIVLVFDDGSFLAQRLKDDTAKAFNVKLFTGVKKVKTGAEGGGSSLMIDIVSSAMAAWQGSSAIYESNEIDFTELNPVAALDLKLPILVAGATTTKITITNKCADSVVGGLVTPGNWKMRRNGVLEAVTAVSEVAGEYTFTHAALVAGNKISFESQVAGYPVITLDTNYYVGKSMEKTVA